MQTPAGSCLIVKQAIMLGLRHHLAPAPAFTLQCAATIISTLRKANIDCYWESENDVTRRKHALVDTQIRQRRGDKRK